MADDLCIVLARGGSKRVPGKNIRPLMGKPLVAWPVSAAKESGLFSRIVISTDDDQIAQAAIAAGAERPFVRPAELADDFTSTRAVLGHALDELAKHGPLSEFFCYVYGTAFLLTPTILQEARQLLHDNDIDGVVTLAAYSHPIERAYVLDGQGIASMRSPEFLRFRTQDLATSYYDIGLMYWLRTQAFFDWQAAKIADWRSKALIVPRIFAVDIDTEEDWELAEITARRLWESARPGARDNAG
ncbi:MAG: pseudaminic acid cytidylyltransferase [Deltaproteobacteria bacterium]|jgi:N-acylneuraminate cytidylyltransferase|nr:pseudaminic acid cytidylyltransferase [Deltaproteobacteria bacterium]